MTKYEWNQVEEGERGHFWHHPTDFPTLAVPLTFIGVAADGARMYATPLKLGAQ
jgi:hypothetical protein